MDGREIHFHEDSVLNSAFQHLDIGRRSDLVGRGRDKGPQANTIRLAGKH
jgi:hypothetical protein